MDYATYWTTISSVAILKSVDKRVPPTRNVKYVNEHWLRVDKRSQNMWGILTPRRFPGAIEQHRHSQKNCGIHGSQQSVTFVGSFNCHPINCTMPTPRQNLESPFVMLLLASEIVEWCISEVKVCLLSTNWRLVSYLRTVWLPWG